MKNTIDPFDTMRANRVLAPHDPKLNDIRWLVGESLRRIHTRSKVGDDETIKLMARYKLRVAQDRVGPHAWTIVTRIVIEGASVRDCRDLVPDFTTPWRADAVIVDRLRVALDRLGPNFGA